HLAGALRVDVGGVEEGDAALDRAADDRLGRRPVEHPRPIGVVAVAHHAQAHARDVQAGGAESDLLHQKSSLHVKSGAYPSTRRALSMSPAAMMNESAPATFASSARLTLWAT